MTVYSVRIREKRSPKWKMSVSKDMPDFYPWWKEKEFPKKVERDL